MLPLWPSALWHCGNILVSSVILQHHFAAAKMESLGQSDGLNFRIFSGCFQTMPTKLLQNILIHGA